MSIPAETFDVVDPLPVGRLAIEASAGTGKTYTLAALATRVLAERDVAASELLVVTFTRAATAELRARVRERIVGAAAHLERVRRHDDDPTVDLDSGGDPVLDHLGDRDVELRLARLRRAVTEFDNATITTIHGFATQVLGTLGVAAGADPDAALVDDSAQLAAECCADELAAAALAHDAERLPRLTTLVERTRTAINIADLRVEPVPGRDDADPASLLLSDLVTRSIARMRRRRRDASTLSFDDVLVELRSALDGPGSAAAVEALRQRFRVALIDEFQDTDPVQWDIFRRVFPDTAPGSPGSSGSPGSPEPSDGSGSGRDRERCLVLVGDPKQAIYSFRGANVHTYLSAVDPDSGTERRSLGTNWRSDGAVLRANEVLLGGVTFGDDRIGFTPVRPAPDHAERRLRDSSGADLPALSIRLALGDDLLRTHKGKGPISKPDATAAITADLVDRVRDLLDGARIPGPDGDAAVRPSDIAVLVRTAAEAELVQASLKAQGVPAVLARGSSVLESVAAQQWRWLLDALQRPSDPGRARAFALSWFCGHSAEWVHGASDDELATLQEQLQSWVTVLSERGVVDFQRRLWAESGVVARVLAHPDGDRELTDLDHVAELLCDTDRGGDAERASPAGLLAILDAPAPVVIEADVDRDVASRRIESEAQAVQVMTVWVAKGLEFPIVMVPTMWSYRSGQRIYVDPDSGRRCFDVAPKAKWPDSAGDRSRGELSEAESCGEELRLLYVALTRARHQTVLWWSRGASTDRSALSRVLFARDGDATIDPGLLTAGRVPLPPDDEAAARLDALVGPAGGTISVGVHGHPPRRRTRWTDPRASVGRPPLELAHLGRRPDRSRGRWSFTAITSRSDAHGGAPAHAPDPVDASLGDAGSGDEPEPDGPDGPDELDELGERGGPSVGVPAASRAGLAMLPAGAAFGTLAHAVLEHVDVAADDLDEQLRAEVTRQLARRPLDLTPVDGSDADGSGPRGEELLVDGLRSAIDTPLGPLFDDGRLRDVRRADRLDEMDFDLRLGDGPGSVTDADVGRLIESHLVPVDLFDHQPLHDWAAGLTDGRFGAVLAGHLTGSIDAVLRRRDSEGTPRYVVVDYKTNRLTPRGRVPGRDDYAPARLTAAMAEHHYPLQALLYSVALHRYLRWRQPGYDPAVHLGGAAYLFLRGMTGPDTPITDGERHGVFSWPVPTALVVELSDLLAGHLRIGAAS